MAQKSLIKLVILLSILGIIALIIKLSGPGEIETVDNDVAPTGVFNSFDVKDVGEISIKSNEGELNLSKQEGGVWTIAQRAGYPANGESIANLLFVVWDLKVTEVVKVGESQHNRLSLISPDKGNPNNSATIVTFLNSEGKEMNTLWLGKVYERKDAQPSQFGGPSTTPVGRYVKTAEDSPVYLVGNPFREISTDPSEWLNENFFKVANLKSIAIETGNKEDDWKLIRGSVESDFRLANPKDGEELDTGKVVSMKTAFDNPRFEDVLVDAEKPSKTTFKIETFDDFSYTVSVGEKSDLNEYALTFDVSANIDEKRKPGDEESAEEAEKLDAEHQAKIEELKAKLAAEKQMAGKVYQVRSFVVDSINKTRGDIVKEQEEIKPEEVVPLPSLTPTPTAPAAPKPAQPKAKGKGKAKAKSTEPAPEAE